MGNTASKATRKFPTKLPDTSKLYTPVKDLGDYAAEAPKLQNRPDPQIHGNKNQEVTRDGQDPQFLQMLRQHGPVKYDDAAVTVPARQDDPMASMFEARSRLQQETDRVVEEGDPAALRQTLEMSEILGVLKARQAGLAEHEVEAQFRLAPGLLSRLGFAVNTPTETGERDALGNIKGTWQ